MQNHVVWLSVTQAARAELRGEGFYVRDGIPGVDRKAKGPYGTKREALLHIDGCAKQTRPTSEEGKV